MSEEAKKSLGEIIKADMNDRGIKATVIAKKMNVSRQSINQIDQRKKFDLEFLQNFKKASGLDYTQYAYDNYHLNDRNANEYMTTVNSVTLTLNVRMLKNNIDEFSKFLKDVEDVARKYSYQIV